MINSIFAAPGPRNYPICSRLLEGTGKLFLWNFRVNTYHFLCYFQYSLVDAFTRLSTDFEVRHIFFLENLGMLWFYFHVRGITLVGKNVGMGVLWVGFALLEPILNDIFEGFLISDIIDHYYSLGPLVVWFRDAPKSLLPGCVPDLQFYIALPHYHWSDLLILSTWTWSQCLLWRCSCPRIRRPQISSRWRTCPPRMTQWWRTWTRNRISSALAMLLVMGDDIIIIPHWNHIFTLYNNKRVS